MASEIVYDRIRLLQNPDIQSDDGSSISGLDDLRLEITSLTSATSNFNEYIAILETADTFLSVDGYGRHVEDKPRKRRNNSFFACVSKCSGQHLEMRKAVQKFMDEHKPTFNGVYFFEHAQEHLRETELQRHSDPKKSDVQKSDTKKSDPKKYFRKLGDDFNRHISYLGNTDVQVTEVDIFATATYLQRPIYILSPMSGEDDEQLFWKFYPPLMETDTRPQWMRDEFVTLLQSHTSDENPRFFKIKYVRTPPRATGMVGQLEKILQERHHRAIAIPDNIQVMDFKQAITSNRQMLLKMEGETIRQIIDKFINDEEIDQERIPPEALSHRTSYRNERFIEFLESLSQLEMVVFCQILVKLGLEDEFGAFVSSSFPADIYSKFVHDCFRPRRSLNLFNSTYQGLFQLIEEIVLECETIALQLVERRGKVNIAAMTGTSAGIVGGIMAVVGVALTPVTFGGSLGLTIAGGLIGGLGGVANAGARITERVKENKDMKGHDGNTNRLAAGYEELDQAWKNVCEAFNIGQDGALAKVSFPGASNAKAAFAVGSILRSIKGFYAIPIAALRIAGAAANIAAGVLGPISLALDIAFLADAAVNHSQSVENNRIRKPDAGS